jgi:predicted nucleic acid-binding protein
MIDTNAASTSISSAQIWVAARLSQATTVMNEDVSPDAVVNGVRLVDPFVSDKANQR